MKLTITRHGQTEENIKGIMQGHLPGTLSERGIQQAKKVATRLKDESFNMIYSSDLARASDTTKEIITFHPNTKTIYTKELRERENGKYKGKKKSDYGWEGQSTILSMEPKSGESRENLLKRANNFLQTLFEKHQNDSILLVAHNGINRALIAAIKGMHHKQIEQVEKLQNCSITVININQEKAHQIQTYNCIKHLSNQNN